MAKTAVHLVLELETSNVRRGVSGSATSTAAASQLGSVGSTLPGGGHRPVAQMGKNVGCRENWRSKNGVRTGNTTHYGLPAQEIKEEVRTIKDLLDVDVQKQFDWSAVEEEQGSSVQKNNNNHFVFHGCSTKG